jgi:hypothetical protein
MNARDFLNDERATALLTAGYQMADAETFVAHAPSFLVQRVARDAGRIDYVTLWDERDSFDGFAVTMSDSNEAYMWWVDHMEAAGYEVPV